MTKEKSADEMSLEERQEAQRRRFAEREEKPEEPDPNIRNVEEAAAREKEMREEFEKLTPRQKVLFFLAQRINSTQAILAEAQRPPGPHTPKGPDVLMCMLLNQSAILDAISQFIGEIEAHDAAFQEANTDARPD